MDVSVVIPCYNAARTIERTLSSVRAQRFDEAEVIVVDDGSSDDSVDVVRRIAPEVRLLTGPNRGACHARNLGLKQATGAYVMFLDADDEVRGDYFEAGLRLARQQRADMVFAPVAYVNGSRQLRRKPCPPDLPAPELFEGWLRGMQLNPTGLIWRREFVERIGGWDETVLINQDGEIVLRAFMSFPVIARNPRGEGVYHVQNATSLSGRRTAQKLANYVETLERFLTLTQGTAFAERTGGIEDTLYGVARMAFRDGHAEVGRRALAILRGRGPLRHRGNVQHRIISSLLGLEGKVRLWGS